MSGYTPDEKLRLQQLRELRRRWLKDQELSPREPVLPPRRVSPVELFWNKFLQDGALWKNVNVIPGLYSAENHSSVVFIFGVSSHFLEAVVKSHQLWVMNTVSQNSLGLWLIIVIYKTYRHSIFAFTHVLIPVWIIHYYLKYHVTTKPYTIVEKKPKIFPGDTILETGEVIPPMKEFPDQHH